MSGYKTHLNHERGKTLCGLMIKQPGRYGDKVLPLADFPLYTTCRNCFTIHYGDIVR